MRAKYVLAGVSVGLCASFAGAAPLNLQLQDTPDILSGFIAVNYNAATDAFNADGFALQIDFPALRGVAVPISDGIFTIDAVIDGDGNFSSGGLVISGVVADERGLSNTVLIAGTLVALGFPSADRGAGALEFLFDITGGSLADLFGPQAGVILTEHGFAGWSQSWENDFNGASDTAPPVPAPFTAALFAGAGLMVSRRRR